MSLCHLEQRGMRHVIFHGDNALIIVFTSMQYVHIFLCAHFMHNIWCTRATQSALHSCSLHPFPSFHLLYSPHTRLPVTTSSQNWSIQLHMKNLSMPLEICSIHKGIASLSLCQSCGESSRAFLGHGFRMAFWTFLLVSEDPIWISYGLTWFAVFVLILLESLIWPWCLACVSIWYLIWVAIQTGTILMKNRNSDEPATMSSSSIIFGCRLLRKSEKVEPIDLSLFLSLGANSC